MKKIISFMLASAFAVLGFMIPIALTDNIIFGFIGVVIGSILAQFVGFWLLKHPFWEMLDGNGHIGFMMDSSAIIKPINCDLDQPYVSALLDNGKEIRSSYDRNVHAYLQIPRTGYYGVIDNHLVYTMPKDEVSNHDFEFEDRTAFLINGQMGQFIPKQFLTDKENDIYADHQMDYLSRMEEDESGEIIRYTQTFFQRIFSSPWLQNIPWLLILVIVVALGIGIYFWPTISVSLGLATQQASGAVGNAAVNLRPPGT